MKKLLYIFLLIVVGFLIFFYFEKNWQKYILTDENPEKNLVQIIAKNQNNEIISRSTGWKISDQIVITALHNVENEQYMYTINNILYRIILRDDVRDLAVISTEKINLEWDFFEKIFKNTFVGEKVSVYVWRDDGLKKIPGNVTAIDIEVMAMGNGWDIKKIVIQSLTDADVLTGDSGSPIWNERGEIVGLVHISRKQ